MARTDGKRENQHYVPKLLLRNFTSTVGAKRGSEQIWVFDKSTDRVANPNIKNIAAQHGFYDTRAGNQAFSLESALSELEDHVTPALMRMVGDKTCSTLSTSEKDWFATFCAVQFTRVQNFRLQTKRLNAALEKKIRDMGGNPSEVTGLASISSDEEVKDFSLGFIARSAREFSAHFATKKMFLIEAPAGERFYIGDNPITLHNEQNFGPYGNIGLAVPGIEIYLPITASLVVGMWEPSNLETFERSLVEAKLTRDQLVTARWKTNVNKDDIESDTKIATKRVEALQGLVDAVQKGSITVASSDLVTFINSLQVRYASRFVMSSANDFGLVKRMIGDNTKYRSGLQMEIG